MTQDPAVARINALTQNARGTWFSLLGVLTFVGVTLLSIEPIDFFGVDRQTVLPIVGVAIPTRLFALIAPVVTAVFYGYFHVQLIRLWDAIARADAVIDDQPLARLVSPWLVIDLALQLRSWRQRDGSTEARALDLLSNALNLFLAWMFGLIVAGAMWWSTMVARDLQLSLIAAACLLAMGLCAYASLWVLWHRMGGDLSDAPTRLFRSVTASTAAILLVPLVLIVTHSRTHEPSDWIGLAAIDLTGHDLIEHPADFLPYHLQLEEFQAEWCEREGHACRMPPQGAGGVLALWATAPTPVDPPKGFEDEWRTRRSNVLKTLRKPAWSQIDAPRPDFRNADLNNAFLTGAVLSGAQLSGADLTRAQIEGADLSNAQLRRAMIRNATLEGARLHAAQLIEADLSNARLDGADLSWAQMTRANLRAAQLLHANLSLAHLRQADLREAVLKGTNLFGAQLPQADLRLARLINVTLGRAQLVGANLSALLILGTADQPKRFDNTDLSASLNAGGALRYVDLTGALLDTATDWRNVFYDASVRVPAPLRGQIGQPCLRDLPSVPLEDAAFFARWRGWLQMNPGWDEDYWPIIAPERWHDIPAVAPPRDCRWITDPLPSPPAQ